MQHALQKERDNPAAHYGLGQVALSRRNYAEAVEHFEKALALAPEANRIHYALAMAYRGLRKLREDKDYIWPNKDRSACAWRIRSWTDCENWLKERACTLCVASWRSKQKDMKKPPPSFVKLSRQGLTVFQLTLISERHSRQLGDLKGAAEEFKKAVVIDPNNTNAHYNLAVLLANEKQHQQAIVHLQAVTNINPNDSGARFFLAQQLLKANRAEEALKTAQSLYSATRALQHGALMSVALAELGRCDEAAAWQRKLIARAVEEHNEEFHVKLTADLRRYENVQTCQR